MFYTLTFKQASDSTKNTSVIALNVPPIIKYCRVYPSRMQIISYNCSFTQSQTTHPSQSIIVENFCLPQQMKHLLCTFRQQNETGLSRGLIYRSKCLYLDLWCILYYIYNIVILKCNFLRDLHSPILSIYIYQFEFKLSNHHPLFTC